MEPQIPSRCTAHRRTSDWQVIDNTVLARLSSQLPRYSPRFLPTGSTRDRRTLRDDRGFENRGRGWSYFSGAACPDFRLNSAKTPPQGGHDRGWVINGIAAYVCQSRLSVLQDQYSKLSVGRDENGRVTLVEGNE